MKPKKKKSVSLSLKLGRQKKFWGIVAILTIIFLITGLVWPGFLRTKAAPCLTGICSIDNKTPINGSISDISETPHFVGMAAPNSNVSVYEQPPSSAPTFSRINDGQFSLQHQDPVSAHGAFVDDFNSYTNNNDLANTWQDSGGPDSGLVDYNGGKAVGMTTGSLGSDIARVTNDAFEKPEDMYQQIDVTMSSIPGSVPGGIKFGFQTDEHETQSLDLIINLENNGTPSIVTLSSSSGNGPSNQIGEVGYSFTLGNTYTIKIEHRYPDVYLYINDAIIISNSWFGADPTSSLSVKPYFGVRASNDVRTYYFDNFVSNLPTTPSVPEGYSLTAPGMILGNDSYNEPAYPLDPNIPGILYWGDQNPQPLPYMIPLNEFHDGGTAIYAYLLQLEFPPHSLHSDNQTTLYAKWTVYSAMPPEIFGPNIVVGINHDFPAHVDAYAKVATNYIADQSSSFTSSGTIDSSGILHGITVEPILIAQTTSGDNGDGSGDWDVNFGVGPDVNLSGQNLTSLHPGPYHFFARAASNEKIQLLSGYLQPNDILLQNNVPFTDGFDSGDYFWDSDQHSNDNPNTYAPDGNGGLKLYTTTTGSGGFAPGKKWMTSKNGYRLQILNDGHNIDYVQMDINVNQMQGSSDALYFGIAENSSLSGRKAVMKASDAHGFQLEYNDDGITNNTEDIASASPSSYYQNTTVTVRIEFDKSQTPNKVQLKIDTDHDGVWDETNDIASGKDNFTLDNWPIRMFFGFEGSNDHPIQIYWDNFIAQGIGFEEAYTFPRTGISYNGTNYDDSGDVLDNVPLPGILIVNPAGDGKLRFLPEFMTPSQVNQGLDDNCHSNQECLDDKDIYAYAIHLSGRDVDNNFTLYSLNPHVISNLYGGDNEIRMDTIAFAKAFHLDEQNGNYTAEQFPLTPTGSIDAAGTIGGVGASDSDTITATIGGVSPPVCNNDSICDLGEDNSNCPHDCPVIPPPNNPSPTFNPEEKNETPETPAE